MLIKLDVAQGRAEIALTEITSIYELITDWSYLLDPTPAHVTFDFTHTDPHLTRAKAFEHLPGSFGFHPVDRLVEQLSFIGQARHLTAEVAVVLPTPDSYLGQHFQAWGVSELLTRWQIPIAWRQMPATRHDYLDPGRVILIPLTELTAGAEIISTKIETILDSSSRELVTRVMTSTLRLINGGLLGALYFPATGYLEFSLMNSTAPGGVTPDDQQAALTDWLATDTFRQLYLPLMAGYGSLHLANGLAGLTLLCDGSATAWQEQLDLPLTHLTGRRATVVMQLVPRQTEAWPDFARQRVAWLEQTGLSLERNSV